MLRMNKRNLRSETKEVRFVIIYDVLTGSNIALAGA